MSSHQCRSSSTTTSGMRGPKALASAALQPRRCEGRRRLRSMAGWTRRRTPRTIASRSVRVTGGEPTERARSSATGRKASIHGAKGSTSSPSRPRPSSSSARRRLSARGQFRRRNGSCRSRPRRLNRASCGRPRCDAPPELFQPGDDHPAFRPARRSPTTGRRVAISWIEEPPFGSTRPIAVALLVSCDVRRRAGDRAARVSASGSTPSSRPSSSTQSSYCRSAALRRPLSA